MQVLDRGVQARDDARELGTARCRIAVELRGECPQVAAGHEMLSGAAYHDDAQRRVGGERGAVLDERLHHRQVEALSAAGRLSVSVATGPSRVTMIVGAASAGAALV